MTDQPFWRAKTLDQLSRDEWESLCDGCGKCCLHKLEDMDTGRVHYTNVACRLLDLGTCRCGNYPKRQALVPDCISLDPTLVDALKWMPSTCGYRLVAERKDLPWWHPLVSGDSETVHQAGVSVRGRAVAEHLAGELEDHVVDWFD
ncbi:MAG: YcgN family cysteine cluster protein [Alphaproteobacteria bacterium]|jgi:uncharacterized cysteine cluster protein YcgN (CxxCxxCC family)|nr:YcgN family cysteine cluster protein [Alphaproteobacteria bacterium]